MRYFYATLIFLFSSFSLIAQYQQGIVVKKKSVNPTEFAETITPEDLRKHLTIIASDEFEGRETGTPGNDKAADYIGDFFKKLGLSPVGDDDSYFQKVKFTWSAWNKVALEVNGETFQHKKDFISFPTRNSHLPDFSTDEVLFLGYGIDDEKYSDYKNVNVRGKVLMIYNNEPIKKNGKSRLTNTTELSEWSTNWQKKMRVAHEKGAKAVLIIDHEIRKNVAESLKFIIGSQITLGDEDNPKDNFANSIYISPALAKTIIGKKYKKVIRARKKIQKRGKARNVTIPVALNFTQDKSEKSLIGRNVLGFIEGTDPKLKDEIVVVSAHYDHLGMRGGAIYNGADDNGSGTSTAMEIAEAFNLAKKQGAGPRRSVLVLMMTGEEKGLYGSQYYVEKPIFPLEKTVADINIDMVGRVDEKHKDNPNYVYVIGADRLSTDLHNINEAMNEKYTNLELDYTYNEEDDPNRYYYRSDHYNFAERGIPAVFYFNGSHDDYHRPTDTVEKINFEKMAKIGHLVFYTTWEIANRDNRIIVDKGEVKQP